MCCHVEPVQTYWPGFRHPSATLWVTSQLSCGWLKCRSIINARHCEAFSAEAICTRKDCFVPESFRDRLCLLAMTDICHVDGRRHLVTLKGIDLSFKAFVWCFHQQRIIFLSRFNPLLIKTLTRAANSAALLSNPKQAWVSILYCCILHE